MMSTNTRIVVALLLGLLTASCAGGSAPPEGGDADSELIIVDGDITPCRDDTYCEVGEICYQELLRCIPIIESPCKPGEMIAHECVKDTDCPLGKICNTFDPLGEFCQCKSLNNADGDAAEDADEEAEAEIDPTVRDCSRNPCITFEPPIIEFGAVQLNDTAIRTLNIRNDGGAPLDITDMYFSANTSRDFSWFAGEPEVPFTLIPGESAAFDVKLLPSDPGLDVGMIQIVCNDLSIKDGLPTVSMEGGCYCGSTEIEVAPESGFDFGAVEVGDSVPLQITIYNHLPPGEDPLASCKILTVGPISLDPEQSAHFRLPDNLEELNYIPPDSSYQFRVFYEPKDRDSHAVEVVITHDADINPYNQDNPRRPLRIHLTGQGVLPCLEVEPDAVNFGDITVRYPVSVAIALRSTCDAPVQMCGGHWQDGSSSAYTIIDPAEALMGEIPPGRFATFLIEFYPQSTGRQNAALEICSNDHQNPAMLLPVTGQGVVPVGGD